MTIHSVPLNRPSLAPTLPTYDAKDLTGAIGQAHIVLGDQTYVLRITKSGKLILTK
ncbi:hemin uptake protein HemP [Yoonia sp. BS5-3]|uniref:Hemin uptake protein HemP n=1 Tax=Yoonia phaeophyticola TaxID=3137369 RepID=A0ABZ2V9A8_9RHOB